MVTRGMTFAFLVLEHVTITPKNFAKLTVILQRSMVLSQLLFQSISQTIYASFCHLKDPMYLMKWVSCVTLYNCQPL